MPHQHGRGIMRGVDQRRATPVIHVTQFKFRMRSGFIHPGVARHYHFVVFFCSFG
jgi:hypothetical protein